MRPVSEDIKKTENDQARYGFLFAFSAYFIWGLMPLLWKLMDHVPAAEVTAHRALWSLPVALVVLVALRRYGDIAPVFHSPRKLGILFVCSILISANWAVFIWAIAAERTLETALAYYINPLLTVLLGFVVLGERFSRLQLLAILLAATAVILLTVLSGQFPWLSLFLAGSFAFYGLLRKTVDVGPTQGFLIEILLVAVFALAYIIWLGVTGEGLFLSTAGNTILLVLAGPATAVPLILYAAGGKRLRLSSLGLMQFIVPTMIFIVSIFVFGEPLREANLIAFVLIWIALALYSWSLVKQG